MANQNGNGWSASRVIIVALLLLVLYQVRESQLNKQRGVLNLQTQEQNPNPNSAPSPLFQTLGHQHNATDCQHRVNETRKAPAKVNATETREEDRPNHHTVVLTDDELAELRALRAREQERARRAEERKAEEARERERAEKRRKAEESEKARRVEAEKRAVHQRRATTERLESLRRQNEALLANTKPDANTQHVFENIYTHLNWGADGRGSGSGSSLESTRSIRATLERIIRQYNITSMLDIPCGGMLWMPHVIHSVRQNVNKNFQYHGADIVRNLVESHRREFQGESPKLDFSVVDFTKQPLPQGYDMVFSRDALQHLPLHMTYQFLDKVKASGAKYLLVGSYVEIHGGNRNINAGDYFDINLLESPFNLATPLEINKETTRQVQSDPAKYALLFEVDKMTWNRQ